MKNKTVNFTRGPWFLKVNRGQPWSIASEKDKKSVASVGNARRAVDEMTANALLIAAAPTMFGALVLAHEALTKASQAGPVDYCQELAAIEFALKRAGVKS